MWSYFNMIEWHCDLKSDALEYYDSYLFLAKIEMMAFYARLNTMWSYLNMMECHCDFESDALEYHDSHLFLAKI